MVLPVLAAVAGGLASSLPGVLAGNSAADTQATTARKQFKLAKKQYKAQEELLGDQYDDQVRDVGRTRTRNLATTSAARNTAGLLARTLRNQGLASAGAAYRLSNAANDNALARQRADLIGARDAAISGLGDAGGAAIRYLVDARDKSIAGFQPALGMGNNALAAYSHNLGLGGKPTGYAGLGFTAGDRFLLNEGVTDIQGAAAARGTLESGATLEALERMRAGLAATRRDQSQEELFRLGQMGQNAAGSIANLRTGAADRIAGVRTGTASDIANARLNTAGALSSVTGQHGDRAIGIQDAQYARRHGANTAYANTMLGAADDYANRTMGIDQNWLAGMGGARDARVTGMGNAGNTYQSNALTALANRGDAKAAGAVGMGNAITNGINTGLGIWSYNRAMNNGTDYASGMPNGGAVTGPMARPANIAAGGGGNALSGIGNWIGSLFGRPA